MVLLSFLPYCGVLEELGWVKDLLHLELNFRILQSCWWENFSQVARPKENSQVHLSWVSGPKDRETTHLSLEA
jgi:hypothetical protein